MLENPDARFTLFAPNDRAFQRLFPYLVDFVGPTEAEALKLIRTELPVAQITELLLHHVVTKKLSPSEVLLSRSITMATGEEIRPRFTVLRDSNDYFKDPRLLLSGLNIPASNGVIHTIDQILSPEYFDGVIGNT